MPWPFYLLIIPAGLYLLFILAPTLLIMHLVFLRKEEGQLQSRDLSGTYYDPYLRRLEASYEALKKAPSEDRTILAKDGVTLSGRYFPRGSHVTVLLFHGYNATPETNCGLAAEYFLDRGYNVLLPWMRAHGKSGGLHTTFGIREQEDVLSWCNAMLEEAGTEVLILYGVSMGASAVAFSSDRLPKEVRAIVLDCGFTSPETVFRKDLQRRKLPEKLMMPVMHVAAKLFMHVDMYDDAKRCLKNAKAPVFFIAGECDTTIPPAMVMEAYNAAGKEKDYLLVSGAEHALAFAKDEAYVRERLDAFLKTIGLF